MKNAVIYVRVSTDLQDCTSQINVLNDYCYHNNLTIKKTFREHVSGLIGDRKQLNHCLSFVKDKKNNIDSLIVWELSRIGRDVSNLLSIIKDLNDNKINLFVYKDNLNTLNLDKTINDLTKMYISIMGTFSEIERNTSIERMKRGKRNNVKNYNVWGGGAYIPYGYKKDGKGIVIDEVESKVIKSIFELYLKGNGTLKISNYLNIKKIPNKTQILFSKEKETKWSDKVVYEILKNPIYVGKMRYSGELFDKPELKIIDEKIFNEVNKRLKENFNKKNKHKRFHLLLDNISIKCGLCGKGYYAHKRLSKKDNVYKCLAKRYNTECDNYGIGIDKLNDVIYYNLRRTEQLKKRIKHQLNNNDYKIKIDGLKNEIKNKQKELIKLFQNENLIVDLLLNKKINQSNYDNRYKDLLKNQNVIKKEIEIIEKSIEGLNSINKKQHSINEYLINLKNSSLTLQQTVDILVNEVVIYPLRVNYLSSMSNDYNCYIELFLNGVLNPICFVCSQRTDKVMVINHTLYDVKNRCLKSTKGLTVQKIIHHINYDELVGN